MTELVRQAVREYRERYDAGGPGRLQELLGRTSGCWTHGDGLDYQDAARDEWERLRWLLESSSTTSTASARRPGALNFLEVIPFVHVRYHITRNTKDFPPERYDFVTVPYAIRSSANTHQPARR